MRALLNKLDSDRRHETDHFASKFTGKVSEIFSGLPKPKDPISFTTNDLPLLFTANERRRLMMVERAKQAGKEAPVLSEHGGDRKSEEQNQGSIRTLKRGETTSYLAARLKRDAPDIASRLQRGPVHMDLDREAGRPRALTPRTPLRRGPVW